VREKHRSPVQGKIHEECTAPPRNLAVTGLTRAHQRDLLNKDPDAEDHRAVRRDAFEKSVFGPETEGPKLLAGWRECIHLLLASPEVGAEDHPTLRGESRAADGGITKGDSLERRKLRHLQPSGEPPRCGGHH